MMPIKVSYKVQTQLVTIWDDSGTRLPHNVSRKKHWRTWDKYDERVKNVKAAIKHALAVRDRATSAKWGCIVVIRRVVNGRSSTKYEKIYEAKIGTDGFPHEEFFGVAGDYWRRLLG